MANDLLETISTLQNMAIGNCRKRIEAEAAKTRGLFRNDTSGERSHDTRKKPAYGVTSVLKERHGL